MHRQSIDRRIRRNRRLIMSTIELTCINETISTDTPPSHLYICCGFEDYPTALKGSYSLEGSPPNPTCVALYGLSGTFTLSRVPCGTLYSTPGLPFYVGLLTSSLCCGNPNEENEHIHNWGVGPGSVSYSPDNYCQRDPETGEVAFFLSAQHVGSDCLFTIHITEAVL